MKIIRLTFLAMLFCFCVAEAQEKTDLSLSLNGVKIDWKVFESHEALIRAFGEKNVMLDSVSVGEGFYEKCTTLYTQDKSKTLSVVWKDTASKAGWDKIYWGIKARGWTINNKIHLGVSLKQIEQYNAKPFTLAGFDWDYGGTIVDFRGGLLDSMRTHPIRLLLRLEPKSYHTISDREASSVSGDKDHSSSDSVMQKLDPTIYTIILLREDQ